MDTETRHCCAHWNEKSASSRKQLHGTTSGWIHRCALRLGTWLLHKSFNGCLHSLGQAFSTSYGQGSQFPFGFTRWMRRIDLAERRYDGSGYLGVQFAPFWWIQWCSTKSSTDGFSAIDGLDENSSFELAEQSFHDCSGGT